MKTKHKGRGMMYKILRVIDNHPNFLAAAIATSFIAGVVVELFS